MTHLTVKIISLCVALTLLGACAEREEKTRSLLNIRDSARNLDEFAIEKSNPLVIPDNVSKKTLPIPNPRARNRAEVSVDKILNNALQNNGARGVKSEAFLKQATRFGIDDNIRAELSREDRLFRENAYVSVVERVGNVAVYFRLYEEDTLDVNEELRRLRNLKVKTPNRGPAPTPRSRNTIILER